MAVLTLVVTLAGLLIASSASAASWGGWSGSSRSASVKSSTAAPWVFGGNNAARTGPQPSKYRAGEVLVRYKPGASLSAMAAANKAAGAASSAKLGKSVAGLYTVTLKKGVSVGRAIAAYRKQAVVAYAQPNYLLQVAKAPNDPDFGELWGLENTGQMGGVAGADIDATQAWDTATGSTSGDVVVAVVDTGVDYTHPDLAANMWTNPGEIPGDNIDNDGNGYVDDIYGIDTVNKDSDPMDDYGHGTHCSGTIGAVGDNGIGVVGVNWNVKIMALKFLDANGYGDTADAITAFEYGAMMGADVFSNSWGGGPDDKALDDCIASINKLFVFAAGNWSENTDFSTNYPSGANLPNILAVGASTRSEEIAVFSNYGQKTVDVFAPGDEILSTVPNNGYEVHGGTSMATPHVAGTAALVLAENPGASWEWLKLAIMGGAEPKDAYAGKALTGARLNADLALDSAAAAAGSVTGVVSFNGEPVEGVKVSVGSTVYATTDADGVYSLAGIPAGTQTIVAESPDYLTQVVNGVLVQAGASTTLRRSAASGRQDHRHGDGIQDRLGDREHHGERLSQDRRHVDAGGLGEDRQQRHVHHQRSRDGRLSRRVLGRLPHLRHAVLRRRGPSRECDRRPGDRGGDNTGHRRCAQEVRPRHRQGHQQQRCTDRRRLGHGVSLRVRVVEHGVWHRDGRGRDLRPRRADHRQLPHRVLRSQRRVCVRVLRQGRALWSARRT